MHDSFLVTLCKAVLGMSLARSPVNAWQFFACTMGSCIEMSLTKSQVECMTVFGYTLCEAVLGFFDGYEIFIFYEILE